MDFERACKILDIKKEKIDTKELKRQYYLKALECHPDKSSDKDAAKRFQEVKEAYDYMKDHYKWNSCFYGSGKETDEGTEFNPQMSSYESILRFFAGTLDEHLQEEYTNILLDKLLNICEKQAIEMLKKANDRKFNAIYKILTKYKNVFHLSQHFYDEMEKNKVYRFVQGEMKKKRLYEMVKDDMNLCEGEFQYEVPIPDEPYVPVQPPLQKEDTGERTFTHKIINYEWGLEIDMEIPYQISKEYNRPTETMILKPTLDDLWENNLYKYTRDKVFLIPLWHHEIIYELNEETDFVVKLKPKMPSNNIWIDENNNLHQTQEYSLYEIWDFASKEQSMFVHYGKKKFMYYPHEMHIKKYQVYVWKNQGISLINEENTFDVSKKGDVILHIYIK